MIEIEKVKQGITSAIIKMGTKWFESRVYAEFEREMERKGLDNKIENLKVLKDLMEIQTIKIQERIDYRLERMKACDIISKLVSGIKAPL